MQVELEFLLGLYDAHDYAPRSVHAYALVRGAETPARSTRRSRCYHSTNVHRYRHHSMNFKLVYSPHTISFLLNVQRVSHVCVKRDLLVLSTALWWLSICFSSHVRGSMFMLLNNFMSISLCMTHLNYTSYVTIVMQEAFRYATFTCNFTFEVLSKRRSI